MKTPLPEWHHYYTWKRITHQWMQVHLLQDLEVRKILEVGPYLGLVTAMLGNAGYDVVAFDIDDRYINAPTFPNVEKIIGDITALDISNMANREIDAVICCETLEHIPYSRVSSVLDNISETRIRYLILSVPYMGMQFSFNIYLNRYVRRRYTSFKKLLGFKNFPKPRESKTWEPHKWEIGYRDYPLADFRELVERRYNIVRMEFTEHCRSVFLVCENRVEI